VGHRVVTSVLIVDDDEQLRRAVTRVLATYDFDCRAVGTVHEAIAAAAEQGPDIVLLDVALGAASGLDIHKAIRDADSRLPAVIFTTSHRDVFSTMLDQLGPIDDWIIKPWDTAEFVARVRLAARRIVEERAAGATADPSWSSLLEGAIAAATTTAETLATNVP
jgi:two-component system OmpR family response regulator